MPIRNAPGVRKSPLGVIDLKKELEWLKEHWQKHMGEWVVLDGDRLIGHGSIGFLDHLRIALINHNQELYLSHYDDV